jgi:hypothetical protein
VGSAGWFPGTARWAESEFFRVEITAVEPVTRSGSGCTTGRPHGGRDHVRPGKRSTRLANRAVAALLRSPGHRVLSGSVALARYRGRRTGREVTLPVQYVRRGDHVLIVPGHPETKTWWRNFEDGTRPIDLLIQGRWVPMTAQVVRGNGQRREITPLLTAYATRFPGATRQWRRDAAQPSVVLDCRPLAG